MNDQAMTTQRASAKQRNNQTLFKMEDLNNIAIRIESEPVPERAANKAAALAMLAPVFHKARRRGHTLATLVKLCEDEGMHVSERDINRAISAARASKTVKKKTVATTS